MAAPRALFVAEAVSLAHVARPAVLARALQSAGWEVNFAYSGNFSICTKDASWDTRHIESISPETFLKRLSAGVPLYTRNELQDYIASDLRVLKESKPDVVIGDFRLSLGVAARLAKIPYLAICNAHWSPWRTCRRLIVPDIPMVRWLGVGIASTLLRGAWPIATRLHAQALNSLRKQYGLPSLSGVEAMYTDGDYVLYADTPDLVPCTGLPANHYYLGPIVWSPHIELPKWWDTLPDRPLVYVTLGSTGEVDLLPLAIDACEAEGMVAMAATAGRSTLPISTAGHGIAPYLPGDRAAARAAFTICNGGSASAYQTLALGRPVLGICSNMDQFLTMSHITRARAGIIARASQQNVESLRKSINMLKNEIHFSQNARTIQASFARYNAPTRIVEIAHSVKNKRALFLTSSTSSPSTDLKTDDRHST